MVKAACDRARGLAALCFLVVAGLDPTLDFPAGLVEEVRQLVDAGEQPAAGRPQRGSEASSSRAELAAGRSPFAS